MSEIILLLCLFVMLCAIGAGCSPAKPSARIEPVSYGRWREAWRLSNGTVDVVVVPEIGRVVRYGYVDGPNVLWDSTEAPRALYKWMNYGGDKQWAWPQAQWKWPPPVAIDTGPYSATIRGDRLLLRSPIDSKLKIRAEREIRLAPDGTELTQVYRIVGEGTDQPWGAWSITQVPAPSRVLAHLRSGFSAAATQPLRTESGNTAWPAPQRLADDWIAFSPVYRGGKIHVPADALGVIVGETFFLQQRRPHLRDETLPAGEVAQLFAMSQKDLPDLVPYVELEFISPPQPLGRNLPAAELTVAWSLHPASAIGDVNN